MDGVDYSRTEFQLSDPILLISQKEMYTCRELLLSERLWTQFLKDSVDRWEKQIVSRLVEPS